MTPYARIVAVAVVFLTGVSVMTWAGYLVSSSSQHMEGISVSTSGPCPTMLDCVASPSCPQHCSSLITDDAPFPVTPAVTSAHSQAEPVLVQAVAADVHKPPPRLTQLG